MHSPNITDSITNGQNKGIACPHCSSISGHFGFCFTITGQTLGDYVKIQDGTAQPKALGPNVGDHILLKAFGITWKWEA
jgi:hypothetical protein